MPRCVPIGVATIVGLEYSNDPAAGVTANVSEVKASIDMIILRTTN